MGMLTAAWKAPVVEVPFNCRSTLPLWQAGRAALDRGGIGITDAGGAGLSCGQRITFTSHGTGQVLSAGRVRL